MAPVTIGRRFTQLIQHLGVSKNAFAQSLDKTATVIQHLVDERNKPGYDLLCKVFEVYPDVSKDWLLLGKGPMLTAGSEPSGVAAATLTPTLFEAGSIAAVSAPQKNQATDLPASAVSSGPKAAPTQELPVAAAASTVEPEKERSPATTAVPANAWNLPLMTPPASTGLTEAVLTAALHAQHLQHQLALSEQRNQHLLDQQRLMQQLLDFAQRR